MSHWSDRLDLYQIGGSYTGQIIGSYTSQIHWLGIFSIIKNKFILEVKELVFFVWFFFKGINGHEDSDSDKSGNDNALSQKLSVDEAWIKGNARVI